MKFDVKGSSGYVSCTGLVEILDAYSDGYDSRPLNIRIIGKVTADGVVGANSDTNNLNLKTNNTKKNCKKHHNRRYRRRCCLLWFRHKRS